MTRDPIHSNKVLWINVLACISSDPRHTKHVMDGGLQAVGLR